MPLALLADENFHGDIVRGLLRRDPQLDIVRVQDVGLTGAADHAVLEWAAQSDRVLLTHDVATITAEAYRRAAAGLRMPGVIEVSTTLSIGRTIDEILLVVGATTPGELEGQVLFVPL
jgi:hypothetical protein